VCASIFVSMFVRFCGLCVCVSVSVCLSASVCAFACVVCVVRARVCARAFACVYNSNSALYT
jgi:hypothetical protein